MTRKIISAGIALLLGVFLIVILALAALRFTLNKLLPEASYYGIQQDLKYRGMK